jgi:putative endonuclease
MKAEKSPAVYIVASNERGTLYIGVTGDLCSRALQHRQGLVPGFTKKYGVKRLVWFEHFGSMDEAILREKRIKEWKRDWKVEMVEKANPLWLDLFAECGGPDIDVYHSVIPAKAGTHVR